MKKKQSKSAVQTGLSFFVEVKPIERLEKQKERVQTAEVLHTGELGLNANWKEFGNYVKNLRGNKI